MAMLIVVEASVNPELPGTCSDCEACAFQEVCQQKYGRVDHPMEETSELAYSDLLADVQDLT